jgi:hypothetical protein
MRLSRIISSLCLALLIWGMQDISVYAQKKDSPESSFNAINLRFQKFDNTPVTFADSVKFRDRFYNVFSAGIEADWERTFDLNTPMTGLASRLTFGYRITPVHAVETDFLYSDTGSRHSAGLNVNWAMNLNNLALRRDSHNRFEVLFIAGASYRQSDKASVGINTGLRLQWNPGKNAGLFIEPKLNIMSDPYSSRTFSTVPSISFGLTLRYHKPDYYLWDYLTPFAIKTNLLYDAASVLNIGIEAPIRDRWSVAFDWVCPWWSSYERQKYLQLLYGSLEGRYWFGNREDKLQLTGWFAGIAAGGGIYDLMYDAMNGIQGEFSTCGVVGGFAHTVNKSGTLRLEYSVGLGWMGTEYVKYWWDEYDYTLIAPSPQTWRTNWFGPIKAQVSLVYMLKIRSKVSGR